MNPTKENIVCQHCNQIIGFKHYLNNFEYNAYTTDTIISTNKFGVIIRSNIKGIVNTETFGDCDTHVGYLLEAQFKCLKCGKKTTVRTWDEY